jgi:hypothetical protein
MQPSGTSYEYLNIAEAYLADNIALPKKSSVAKYSAALFCIPR